MSIEDIYHLKNNSIKQTCVILIDSKNRDLNIYPDPSDYVVNFNVPFKNVIGFDIIDSSIPRTMYSIDKYNNSFSFYIHTDETKDFNDFINTNNDINGIFNTILLPFGDYTLRLFMIEFNKIIKKFIQANYPTKNIIFETESFSDPAELTDIMQFISSHSFILNMNDSTVAETLGFYLLTKKELHNINYTYVSKFNKYFFSFRKDEPKNPFNPYYLISPGMVCFTGEKYILMRSKEIEEHSFGSLAYTNNNLGIAKFRTNSLGFNDEKLYITKIPIREFHPIGKLSQLSIRFETANRLLYDFKGINHNITLAIYYYEPSFKQIEKFNSILNPNYTTNFNNYKYTNDEQEIINEDDDDEDDIDDDVNENYSRDNINIYKKMEQKFNY